MDVEPVQPVPSSSSTDAVDLVGLVTRAQRGDAAAFTELIRRYERMALSIAYSVIGRGGAAGDVVQEAFVRAWQRLRDLKDPARFGPWLGGVVRNGAIDARRRARLQPRSLAAMPNGEAVAVSTGGRWASDPLGELGRRERHDLLAAALEELEETSRTAVMLRYYDGLSSREIGEILDLAPTAVDMRISRARRQLRDKLEESGVFAGEGPV